MHEFVHYDNKFIFCNVKYNTLKYNTLFVTHSSDNLFIVVQFPNITSLLHEISNSCMRSRIKSSETSQNGNCFIKENSILKLKRIFCLYFESIDMTRVFFEINLCEFFGRSIISKKCRKIEKHGYNFITRIIENIGFLIELIGSLIFSSK